MTGFTATIIKFITALLIADSFFLGHFYTVQACEVVSAVSKEDSLLCPAGLESKIVDGLGAINECAEKKLNRNRNLKGSNVVQEERQLAFPLCCNPYGGTCPYWWCKSQPGCRRRDLSEGEEEVVDSGRELAAYPWSDMPEFKVIKNKDCLPPGNSAVATCLQNAVTAAANC
ncbi:hypothetical protein ACA910_018652 [Epithemia clementina (nom. ined.)]